MKTLLAIDAGNSSVKYGHFRDGELVEFWRHDVDATERECPSFLSRVDGPVALASVAPSAGQVLVAHCKKLGRPLIEISAEAQNFLTGMDNTMGADRVADAVAAWKGYGKGQRPVVLMGFGTATTLLAISAQGHIEGGWIAPGVEPTMEVLHERCQLLPLLKLEGHTEKLGFDTDSHMKNGVYLAHVGLVRQWLETSKAALSEGTVTIGTGGWSKEFAALFDHVDRELTLRGVYLIAQAAVGACKESAIM